MTQFKTATIGSISHGTMRNADLLETFASELESRMLLNAAYFSLPENMAERDRLSTLFWDATELAHHMQEGKEDGEHATELVNTLSDALNDFAPAYCYFGSHPGDGSDYGYWPSMESVTELETFSDLSEVPDGQEEDFAIINDHGNVTVYAATPEGYKEIFGIV